MDRTRPLGRRSLSHNNADPVGACTSAGPIVAPAEASSLAVARSLWLDLVTSEVARLLSAQGITCILLKGPAIAHYLYPGGAYRPYDDIDILVDAADLQPVGAILTGLRFRDIHADTSVHERIPYAQAWVRAADASVVDLHWSLEEAEVPPVQVWAAVSTHTEMLRLGGMEVAIPSRCCIAAIVALHAAHHGTTRAKPLNDLRRALDRIPRHEWEVAADLARTLHAEGAFAAGLRLLPEGEALGIALGLSGSPSTAVVLRAASAAPTAEGFAQLFAKPGLRAKLSLLGRKVWPTPAFLRIRWPLARRCPVGLLVARAQRVAYLLIHAGPGLRAVWRARRAGAGKVQPGRPRCR